MKYKKVNYEKSMLGCCVTVVTKDAASQWGFEVNKAYKGFLLDKVDWFVGCPIFKCDVGILGLDYDCYLVELADGGE